MTLSDRYRDRVCQSPPEPHPDDDTDLVALASGEITDHEGNVIGHSVDGIPYGGHWAPDDHPLACQHCKGYVHTGRCDVHPPRHPIGDLMPPNVYGASVVDTIRDEDDGLVVTHTVIRAVLNTYAEEIGPANARALLRALGVPEEG